MLRHCWATLWWVHYHSKIPTHQKISPRNHITSMQIFMTDENMEIINFNGLPLRFELEIIWKKNCFLKIFCQALQAGGHPSTPPLDCLDCLESKALWARDHKVVQVAPWLKEPLSFFPSRCQGFKVQEDL